MRGQEHTVIMYLAWAVFFLAAFVLLQNMFSTTLETAVPTPIPTILDVIRSAINAGETGIEESACATIYPAGELQITKDFIKERLNFNGNIVFVCKTRGSCETDGYSFIKVFGRKGQLCAEMRGNTLTIEWR